MGRGKPDHLIAENLVERSVGLHEAIDPREPQSEEAVVDALHQDNLRHNENWIPDVAAEVACHPEVLLDERMAFSQRSCSLLWWKC